MRRIYRVSLKNANKVVEVKANNKDSAIRKAKAKYFKAFKNISNSQFKVIVPRFFEVRRVSISDYRIYDITDEGYLGNIIDYATSAKSALLKKKLLYNKLLSRKPDMRVL